MTFDEAIAMGREIHETDGVHLMAIGRFVPADQLTGCEDWYCSVAIIGGQPHNICRSVADWRGLLSSELKRQSKETQATEPDKIQHLSEDEQPLLF
jgi:hypothetical protein